MSDHSRTLTRVPASPCPECGKTCHMIVGNVERAMAGHAVLCSGCGKVAIFDHRLYLRPPTVAELASMAADDALQKQLRAALPILDLIWQVHAAERN